MDAARGSEKANVPLPSGLLLDPLLSPGGLQETTADDRLLSEVWRH